MPNVVEHLSQYKAQKGRMHLVDAISTLMAPYVTKVQGWEQPKVAPAALLKEIGISEHWYNAEDNSDLDTSNDSYMSSSDDELPETEYEEFHTRVSFGSAREPESVGSSGLIKVMKELTREEKALVSRRFEPYFRRIRMDAFDYFRPQNRKVYDRKDWMKLEFDGQIKRCNTTPIRLDELLELARSRFGVLEHILETGQFKPLVTFKSPKMAKLVLIETSSDLEEIVQQRGNKSHNTCNFGLHVKRNN